FENEWNFWVYPATELAKLPARQKVEGSTLPAIWKLGVPQDGSRASISDVVVTSSWEEAETKLAAGGRVLFVARNSDLDWTSPPLDSVPVFWNGLMGPAWGRMLGLWIDRKPEESRSQALSKFPTSWHFDWQWAQIIGNVRAVNLDRLPRELEPVVWAIDDWNRNYKLGLIFECVVGDGRLLVSAFDVSKPADGNPVARQLRRSLLDYMGSKFFQPNVSVTPEQMRSLFFDTRIMKKLGVVAQSGGASSNTAIDGDPNTFWLSGSQRAPVRDQAEIVIEFPAPVTMAGLVMMARQNHREHEGDIREYVLQVSDDGKQWSDMLRGELFSTYAPQRIQFPKTITARYLKLISLSGFGSDKTTALAELAVIYAGPKLKEVGDGVI